MPASISTQEKRAIISAYFQVPNRDDVAKRVHRGGGTVTREVNEFKKEAKSKGWKSAAEEYGVSQIIEELHELSVIVNKNNIAPVEAIDGAKIAAALKPMNIDLSNLNQFINQVYTRSKEKEYQASDIVDDCEKIQNLEYDYELSYEEIVEKFEEMGSKISSQREEIIKLNKNIVEAKKRNVNLYDKYVTDKESLENYKNTNDALTKLGLSLKDMEKIETILLALKKEKLNPTKIIKKINEIKDLEESKTFFEFIVKKLKEEYKELENKNEVTKKEIYRKQNILDEATKLEETGLTINDIQKIRNTVIRVSSNHGLTTQQAITKLQTDITKNYDKILGLEPKLTSLQNQKEKLETEIKNQENELKEKRIETETKIQELEDENEAVKEQIDAYINLRRKGVTDEVLLRWEKIIKESKLNPNIIQSNLITQRNLKNLENEFNKKIVDKEQTVKELNSNITSLTSKKGEIITSIETVQQEGIKKIQGTTDKTIEQSRDQIILMYNKITKILSDSITALEKSETTNLSILNDTENNVKETKDNLQTISNQINFITDEAIAAGEKIGNLHPISEAYKFIDTGKGEPNIVIPLTVKFLLHLKTWFQNREKLDYTKESSIDNLIKELQI